MRGIVITSLVTLLCSCADTPKAKAPYSISIHDIPAERASQLQQAATMWNEAVWEEFLYLTPAAEADIQVLVTPQCTPGAGRAAEAFWKEPGNCTICFNNTITKERGPRIFAHELGHCIGLGHDEKDPDSIMDPNAWGAEIRPHHIEHILSVLNNQ